MRSKAALPPNSTVLVHIGKCGGRSLRNGIANATRNADVHAVHIEKPPYRDDLHYLIVARGPVPRLVSAFRWRYKLVVAQGKQKHRFQGEREVLEKYGDVNKLAEALYSADGTPDAVSLQDIRQIHHIREDIAFYLADLLCKCRPDQIQAVLMQENLDADISRVFGYENEHYSHTNPSKNDDTALSDAGRANLMRYLTEDYAALIKLYCWGKIERQVFIKAI